MMPKRYRDMSRIASAFMAEAAVLFCVFSFFDRLLQPEQMTLGWLCVFQAVSLVLLGLAWVTSPEGDDE